MSDFNLDTEFRASVTLHQAGRLEQALQGYRRVLAAVPHQPVVTGYIGMAEAQSGRFETAVRYFERSLSVAREDAGVCNNLGNALGSLGRRADSARAYRRSVVLAPSFCAPQVSLAGFDSEPPAKEARLLRALAGEATYVPAHLSLAQLPADPRRWRSAGYWLRRAVALSPADNFVHAVIANAALAERRPDLSRIAALRALSVGADIATAEFLLARAAEDLNDLDDARRRFRQCVTWDPSYGASHVGLGSLELGLGHPGVAADLYGRAVALSSATEVAAGNLLFATAFLDPRDPQEPVRRAHRWAESGASSPTPARAPRGARRDRRLRIGYVSPEFLRHSFLFQLLPVLEHHDRDRFEVYAYSQATATDAWTDKVRERVGVWRGIGTLDLPAQADAIRSDGIDVLVNLTGYLAQHRALFRHRMATVQVAYINHVASTGLSTIDARITDRWLEPEGAPFIDEGENLIRPASGFSCLSPPADAPAPGALPAAGNGYVTFGVINNLAKVSGASLDAWSRILRRLPTARILIKAYGLSSARAREEVIAGFARRGIAGDRITLVGRIAADRDNLQTIAGVDIALDPFPFNGGLSTGDALWMGVPVVSVVGSQLVGRLGLSFIHRAGFPEWVAPSVDDYVELAVSLAADLGRLAAFRREMRDRLSQSVLLDAATHTRELEGAFLDLWRERAGVGP